MKTKILLLTLASTLLGLQTQAQNNTRVNAANYEISDNLDLRAVASIFGDSRNIEDFERKLNDPEIQISNLDLNNDNEVDYLRVIETVENRTHVVVIQAVLDRDVYQDVATIDLERDRNNNVQIQFVGNEYMYGQNYIYEPVYYTTPVIYASFWTTNYRPYVSSYYWNYYPRYYNAWNPYPVFRYRNNISINININNRYNYVNTRRSSQAVVIYNSRRSNGYERQHPNNGFAKRNTTVVNRYELDRSRNYRNVSSRNDNRYSTNRNTNSREITGRRTQSGTVYSQNRTRNSSSRDYTPTRRTTPSTERSSNNTRVSSRQTAQNTTPQRTQTERVNTQRTSRETSPQRVESQRTSSNRTDTRQRTSQNNSTQKTTTQTKQNTTRQSAPQRTESSRSNNSRERSSSSSRSENGRS